MNWRNSVFQLTSKKSAALDIHPSAPIRKVTPEQVHLCPVEWNPDKDSHRKACSWRDCGQQTFLVTSCWVSHLQSLSEDRHPAEKQTPANTFSSPTVLPGNHSTGPGIRSGVNCPIHVCKSKGSPLLCVEKGSTLHCWSGLASRFCPNIEKSSPYPCWAPLGCPDCSCHPQMYSKICPSDPVQETNFYRTFTPN